VARANKNTLKTKTKQNKTSRSSTPVETDHVCES